MYSMPKSFLETSQISQEFLENDLSKKQTALRFLMQSKKDPFSKPRLSPCVFVL